MRRYAGRREWRRRRDRRVAGSVLIVSVWTVGLLASVTVMQATQVGLQTRLAGRLWETAEASALARSGVAWAQGALAADWSDTPATAWDAANEAWAHPERWDVGFVEEKSTTGWAVRDDPAAPGLVRVRVRDAQGTVPLNDATPEMLARLPALAEIPELPAFAEAVTTARAPGSDGQARPLMHPEELVMRVGVPPEAVDQLMTVARAWGPKAVNLNAASPQALTALGLDAAAAQAFAAQRDERVRSGRPLDTADAVRAFLRDDLGYDATSVQAQTVERWLTEGWAAVQSSVFLVEVEAVTRAHGVRRAVTAVIQRVAPSEMRIIRWQEGGAADAT